MSLNSDSPTSSILTCADTKLLVIVGPTACGKSDLAIDLAKKCVGLGRGADIINADSFALYRGMDIGTAKVPAAERAILECDYGIKHYQIDTLQPTEISTAAEYQNSARSDISKIQTAGRLPILVGGSGLYIRAVIDDFTFQSVDYDLREKLSSRPSNELWNELVVRDPATASTLQPENKRRIIRALEVLDKSETYKRTLPQYIYKNAGTKQLGIDLSREALDSRIDQRTDLIRTRGLLEEVKSLFEANKLGPTAQKAIGYAECLAYLRGENNPANGKLLTLDATFERIAQHTKRLVRRQLSWFKRDPRIEWLSEDDIVNLRVTDE